jgi:hypothetical protein
MNDEDLTIPTNTRRGWLWLGAAGAVLSAAASIFFGQLA